MMLGPGAYFSHLDIDPSAPIRKHDTNAGVKVGVGSAWMFNRNLGIFGEYRFSHFSPSYGITVAPLTLRNIVNTHQLQFGVSLRF
jgi:opacity protein-like surface antigen